MSEEETGGGESDLSLTYYAQILWRRRRTVIGCTLLLLGAVFIASMLQTRYYASTATLEINNQTPVVLEGVQEVTRSNYHFDEARHFRKTQQWIVTSRLVMEEALRRLREEHGVTDFDPEEGAYNPDDPPVGKLQALVKIEPVEETQILKVRVEYPDPAKAALFANVIVESYLYQHENRYKDVTDEASKWLDEQKQEWKSRGITLESAVAKYRAEHGLVTPERTIDIESLETLRRQWSEIYAKRARIEGYLEQLDASIRAGDYLALADHLAADQEILSNALEEYRRLDQARANEMASRRADHPEVARIQRELDGVTDQVKQLVEQHRAGRAAELRLVQAEEQKLSEEYAKANERMAGQSEAYIRLSFDEAEAKQYQEMFSELAQRDIEVGLQKFMRKGNARIVELARPGKAPIRPNVMLNLLGAAMVGLLAGAGIAIVLELVDPTVRSRAEVDAASGAPLLGLVPLINPAQLAGLDNDVDKSIVAFALPRSPMAECLRTVRTNMLFRGKGKSLQRVLVTSASPREGKSFITSNLAALLAASGTRVLAIDADFRRPSLHKRFGLPNDMGLVNIIAGNATLASASQPTHVPGLYILTTGPSPENPSEWISRASMTKVLDAITGYDMVVIDSPPVNVVSDGLVLASLVDGTVFVIEANRSTRDLVRSSCNQLREVNANLLGTVVNKLNLQEHGYQYYYYYNDYYRYYSGSTEKAASTRMG